MLYLRSKKGWVLVRVSVGTTCLVCKAQTLMSISSFVGEEKKKGVLQYASSEFPAVTGRRLF